MAKELPGLENAAVETLDSWALIVVCMNNLFDSFTIIPTHAGGYWGDGLAPEDLYIELKTLQMIQFDLSYSKFDLWLQPLKRICYFQNPAHRRGKQG